MKNLTEYDEHALNELMSLVKNSITSCNGAAGIRDDILAVAAKLVCNEDILIAAAKLVCDNVDNLCTLLNYAYDTSPDMANVFTTVMKKFLVEKDMMYPVFKAYFSDHDAPEQLRMIKELFDLTCTW